MSESGMHRLMAQANQTGAVTKRKLGDLSRQLFRKATRQATTQNAIKDVAFYKTLQEFWNKTHDPAAYST